MEILAGLLYINGNDVLKTYGAFLCEDTKTGNDNYSELLKPPAMKSYTAVSFREEDGEKLPAELTPAMEARDLSLQFAILADNKTDFLLKRNKFLEMLARAGWLELTVPELGKTFRLYYKECTKYTQVTAFDAYRVAGKFKVKFREPKPEL